MSAAADATALLSEHSRLEIDHWLAKFPPERRRSAVIAGLRIAQHQNQGYLTVELMDAVADHVGVPAIQKGWACKCGVPLKERVDPRFGLHLLPWKDADGRSHHDPRGQTGAAAPFVRAHVGVEGEVQAGERLHVGRRDPDLR